MPTYVVQVEKGLSEKQFADARKALEEKGGEIVSGEDDYRREGLAPGFRVSFPADSVQTLQSIPHFYSVEDDNDKEFRIQ